MRKNKKISTFLNFLCIFSSLGVISCGANNWHISLFIYTFEDTFMSSYSNQIQTILRDKYYIQVFDGEASQSYQNDQIVSEINNENSRFLLINLVDRLAAKTIVEKAETVNKPIIFLNREPLEEDLANTNNAFYVGAKPESDGSLQAELANEYFVSFENFKVNYDRNKNGILDLVLIKGEQGHQDTENRSEYSISGLTNLGYEVNVLDTRFCDWNRLTAHDYLGEIYEFYKDDIDLIISNNDDMALGAIDYLKEQEDYNPKIPLYENYFPIIGVDETSVGYEAVLNHEMYGTVRNDYETQVEIIDKLIEFKLNNYSMSDFPYVMDATNSFHTDGIKISQKNIENI